MKPIPIVLALGLKHGFVSFNALQMQIAYITYIYISEQSIYNEEVNKTG